MPYVADVNNDDRVFTMRFENTGPLLRKFRLNVRFQIFTMAIAKLGFEGF
jgi:hypothetical protein